MHMWALHVKVEMQNQHLHKMCVWSCWKVKMNTLKHKNYQTLRLTKKAKRTITISIMWIAKSMPNHQMFIKVLVCLNGPKIPFKGFFSALLNVMSMWNTSNHKKVNGMPMKFHEIWLKWWNVNIFVGRNTCPWILNTTFGNENFEKVSSNWGQLILLNNMKINASFKYLIS
jgi:hypothetical protein